MSEFPANIDLSSLNGTTGFKLSGGAAIDYSGGSVASAGDVNGDGFDDVIVGAKRADPNGSGSGASYVVFGKASGFVSNIDLSSLDGLTGFRLSGAGGYASGNSVASAGDVNGDGFADLIVGAYQADPNGQASGASYVVFGKATGFASNIDLSSLDGATGFKLSGTLTDRSGISVASAGDVNRDGFDDVIVGAAFDDPHGTDSGASFVVFGKATGFASNINLSSLDGLNGFTLSGGAAGDNSGFSVASAGDVNGDGFADLIVGAYQADPTGQASGASYVVFGKAGGFAPNIDLSSLNGKNGFTLSGAAAGDRSGYSVASAGDVNGDGFADLIVGASRAANGVGPGASYVVFGKAWWGSTASIDLSSLDGTTGFKISGANSISGGNGRSVASAGDVNGDGFDDLIVGARLTDPHGSGSGASYVVFGKASGFVSNINMASLDGLTGFKLSGVAAGDASGYSVASAGDVNSDGFADLIVGAPTADPHGSTSGASYVAFGRAPDSAVVRVGSTASQAISGGEFDDSLFALAGDDVLRGNGGGDKLVGGHGNDLLEGGNGNDVLGGGGGDDIINGGAGRDVLKGGAGGDTFVFAAVSDSVVGGQRDVIKDFIAGADTIDLAAIDANSAAANDQAFVFIGDAGFSGAAGELQVRALGANTLVAGDVDGNGQADFHILLSGQVTLQSTDFLL